MDKKIYAAIDANINRAKEGLRVCEDILRFILNSGYSVYFKEFRHQIAELSKSIPRHLLLNGRDVNEDLQKFTDLKSEMHRDSAEELFTANINRAVEAVRCLEELMKTIENGRSQNMQKLRFSLYDIEKRIFNSNVIGRKINKMRRSLYGILDSEFVLKGNYLHFAERLIRGGVSVIQLRMKNSPLPLILDTAKKISSLCRKSEVLFFVNDHPHIAYLSKADGLHLGQDDLPLPEVRKILPETMLIGISTHSLEEAIAASEYRPDYIAIGPVFSTESKNGSPLKGIGTEIVADVKKRVDVPVVAIGGITAENAEKVSGTGCDSVALISALYKDNDIENNCIEMIRKLKW